MNAMVKLSLFMLSRKSQNIAKNVFVRSVSHESLLVPNREEMIRQARDNSSYDVLVIGLGCTGAGVALDARLRGLRVLCIDREDIGSGTSSRSTKLLWGGSRYVLGCIFYC
jgi:heterodisulfide reductase subunit A-like polyferredoxin